MRFELKHEERIESELTGLRPTATAPTVANALYNRTTRECAIMCGLNVYEVYVIMLVSVFEGMSPWHLCLAGGTTTASMLPALRRLSERGYIQKKLQPNCKKRSFVYLTEHGRTVVFRFNNRWADAVRSASKFLLPPPEL